MSLRYKISALVAIESLALSGCRIASGLFSDDQGVPLTEFHAKDGAYFPEFIFRFFPAASKYAETYPSVMEASSGVRLIQIKQLSTSRSKNNEANLSWSADGVYLGFEVVTDRFRKILLKDLSGDFARELQVIPKGGNDFLDGMVIRSAHSYNAGLRWSRDSTRFAFMSNGGLGQYNIYVGAVGTKEAAVAKSPTKDGYAAWSPKTNELTFVSGRSGNGDIYLIDLSSRKLSQLSRSKKVDIFPEWFPSGNRIVYSSGDALNHNLMIVERKGPESAWSRPRYLTHWGRDDLRPTVSPDGRFVAFYSESTGGRGSLRKWDIAVVPASTKKPFQAAHLRSMIVAKDVVVDLNTGPAWSPDSRKLFYVKRDPTVFNPIYAYDLFTGRRYKFATKTRMNRDILVSKLGVLSFRAQVGVWDRVFVALTNQGIQLQNRKNLLSKVHYLKL